MSDLAAGSAGGSAAEMPARRFTPADWRPLPRHPARALGAAIVLVVVGGSVVVWGYGELLRGAGMTTAEEMPAAEPSRPPVVTESDPVFENVFAAPTAPDIDEVAAIAPDREIGAQFGPPAPERAIDDFAGISDDPLDRIEPDIAGPSLPDYLSEQDGGDPLAAPLGPAMPPVWLANAVPVLSGGARPMIAIVMDDMGLDRRRSRRAAALPGPLTLSYLAYADDLARQTAAAREHGHELMVHVPMEPLRNAEEQIDPGPNALTVDLSSAEILDRLRWDLDRFAGYVGINNHMGSRFTSDSRAMTTVMTELKARGLLFLDSKTSANSVGGLVAAQVGVPHIQRDVFLDNEADPAAIAAALKEVERRARASGFAVAIGHPREETLNVLEAWLPTAASNGFAIVPISAIVRHISPAG